SAYSAEAGTRPAADGRLPVGGGTGSVAREHPAPWRGVVSCPEAARGSSRRGPPRGAPVPHRPHPPALPPPPHPPPPPPLPPPRCPHGRSRGPRPPPENAAGGGRRAAPPPTTPRGGRGLMLLRRRGLGGPADGKTWEGRRLLRVGRLPNLDLHLHDSSLAGLV